MAQVSVRRDDEQHRYVALLDDAPAGFAAYSLRPGIIEFTHTEIDGAFEGHGVGSTLAAPRSTTYAVTAPVVWSPRSPSSRRTSSATPTTRTSSPTDAPARVDQVDVEEADTESATR